MNVSPKLELHYQEQGRGRPVLLLHGFGANSFSWKYVARDLAPKYRAISVDLKGFGASPKPADGAYSIVDQADLIVDFIMRHDLWEMTLIGHSFGGAVALLTALKLREQSSERFSSLVLIGPLSYRQHLPSFVRILRMPILSSLALCVTPTEFYVRSILKLAYFDNRKISQEAINAYKAPLRSAGARYAIMQTARNIIPCDIEEISAKYGSIGVPTLLIWGRHDKIVPLGIGNRLHRAIPGSELVIVESAGHAPHEEVPTETSRIISRFLSTTTGKSRASG
jgi:pimeloyl-ACP methyl ester carboxylesterase